MKPKQVDSSELFVHVVGDDRVVRKATQGLCIRKHVIPSQMWICYLHENGKFILQWNDGFLKDKVTDEDRFKVVPFNYDVYAFRLAAAQANENGILPIGNGIQVNGNGIEVYVCVVLESSDNCIYVIKKTDFYITNLEKFVLPTSQLKPTESLSDAAERTLLEDVNMKLPKGDFKGARVLGIWETLAPAEIGEYFDIHRLAIYVHIKCQYSSLQLGTRYQCKKLDYERIHASFWMPKEIMSSLILRSPLPESVEKIVVNIANKQKEPLHQLESTLDFVLKRAFYPRSALAFPFGLGTLYAFKILQLERGHKKPLEWNSISKDIKNAMLHSLK